MSRAVLALLLAVLAAAPAAAARPKPLRVKLEPLRATKVTLTRQPSPLPRLHAERGSRPGVFTADGRQVLLRGVNVNQLGDYYQQNPSLPPRFDLTQDDFVGMRKMGFDVVRLLVHWSALEPSPGVFDEAYLAQIRRAVRWAGKHRLYVVLDMHQDAWGKFVASPPGESCLPPMQRGKGWDGAPEWATLTGGMSRCFSAQREISPAVATAFQAFYDDQQGIQGALVATWSRLAAAFAGNPTVAGYDLLNEPNPGLAIGAGNAVAIAQYYARVTAAIRAAEQRVAGGFAHIAFFEPTVIWSAAGTDAIPTPSLITDPNVVFAPHIYAASLAPISVAEGFANARDAAAQYGTTVWSGEWGFFGKPADDEANIRAYAAQEDGHLWGGAWWDWKQACGDPHQFSDGDDMEPEPVSPSLNRYACPGDVALGIPASTRRVLARPYVRAAPGRITSLESDPDTRVARIAGSDPEASGSCRLVAWVPGKARPRPTGTGVRRVRVRRVPGGWMVTACARDDYTLRTGL